MADRTETTNLVFNFEERGGSAFEKLLMNLEKSIQANRADYQEFGKSADKANKAISKGVESVDKALKNQEGKVKNLRNEYVDMAHQYEQATIAGDKQMAKAAENRMKEIDKAVNHEMDRTEDLYKSHMRKFKEVARNQKKELSKLQESVMGGGKQALSSLMSGDVKGASGGVQSGIKGAGEAAGSMKGAVGGKMSKALGGFAKIAGPLAVVAGTLGTIAKLFVDLDAKIKEVNKTMLDNVPLTSLSAEKYGDFQSQVADAENTLANFRETALTNMDLRMLGLDPEAQAKVLNTLEEEGHVLGQLRREGIGFAEAMETAQVAALNLGVDASDTAGLMGQLMDVSSESFDQAKDTLTQVVDAAQRSGVATQKFFNVVQSTVGEMGLYNYKLEETAALFSKLTNIMDSKSAEKMINDVTTSIKNMSAAERSNLVVTNTVGKVAEMVNERQAQMAKDLDPEKLEKAFADRGLSHLFNIDDLEGSIEKLTKKQRDGITKALDQSAGEQFRKYRELLEVARDDAMALQGVLGDLSTVQQLALKVGDLEETLDMPLEKMNSLLTESRGVNEDQLRMLKALKRSAETDLDDLRAVAGNTEKLSEMADQLGYNVEVNEKTGKLVNAQGEEIKSYTDLLATASEKRAEDLKKEAANQMTTAELTAKHTRSILDTLKYKMIDIVSSMYSVIIDLYEVVSKWFGDSKDGGKERRQRRKYLRDEMEMRSRIRGKEQAIRGTTDEDTKERLQREKKSLESQLLSIKKQRQAFEQGAGTEEASRMDRTKVESVDELRRLRFSAGQKALRAGARFTYEKGGKATEFDAFKGEKHKDYGKLTKMTTAEGETIEGQKAIRDHLDKMVLEMKARDEIEKNVAKALEEGNLTQDKLKLILENTQETLADDGIAIKDKTLSDMAIAFVKAQALADLKKGFAQQTGLNAGQASSVIDKIIAGRTDHEDVQNALRRQDSGSFLRGADAQQVFSSYGVQTGYDARVVSRGVPLLDLQAGDIVVDQESLAQTMVGGKGQFVPELLGKAAGKVSGGGGGGKTLNAYITISGGNVSEIRREILRVIEEWEDERATGGG